MSPLEVLFEADRLPAFALPAALHELYGGAVGFEEPRLYANFVSTVDGTVAVPGFAQSNKLIAGASQGDRFVMGLLRASADVVLIGSGTLRDSPHGTWMPDRAYPAATEAFAELRRLLGRPAQPELAILSGNGSLPAAHPVLETGALVLTSRASAPRLRQRLPGASSVVTIGRSNTIDPRKAVAALRERGHRLILSEAGPRGFGTLLGAEVVDELFLTLSPRLAGTGDTGRLRLVEGIDLLTRNETARLLSVRRQDEHLFLRYHVGQQESD